MVEASGIHNGGVFRSLEMKLQCEEILAKIGNSNVVSTLDLRKGYWQIPMAEGARERERERRDTHG